jgi:hypothetical protein
MKLPLKTRILEYAIDLGKDFVVDDVISALTPEYGGERIFSRKQVEEYIDSYLGVGFLTAESTEFNNKGDLVVHCKVTDYGKSRKKYIKQ